RAAMPPHTNDPSPLASMASPAVPASAFRARLLLVLLCVGWGTTWSTMRIALTEIPPFSMRIGTLFLGALTFAPLPLLQGRTLKVRNRGAWLHLCVASLFNIVGFSVFTPFAQLNAATSRVTIVVYTMPIWASLLARLILGERLTAISSLALMLCAGGLAVLIAPLTELGVPGGILLALGAAISWAAGTIYLKWARLDGDAMAMSVWQLVIGLVVISLCVPLFEGSLHLLPEHNEPLIALVFSGVVGSGISYFLWFDIVRRLPATTASLGVLGTPVIGVIVSVVLLGER